MDLTTRRTLRRAVELLQQVEAPLVGTVFNAIGDRAGYEYGYAVTHGRRYAAPYGTDRARVPGANDVPSPATARRSDPAP